MLRGNIGSLRRNSLLLLYSLLASLRISDTDTLVKSPIWIMGCFVNTSCTECNFKDSQIELLEEEVRILRNLLSNTCQMYQKLNQTVEQSNLTVENNQSDSEKAICSEVEYDGEHAIESYFITNSQGEVEVPDSFLSKKDLELDIDNISSNLDLVEIDSVFKPIPSGHKSDTSDLSSDVTDFLENLAKSNELFSPDVRSPPKSANIVGRGAAIEQPIEFVHYLPFLLFSAEKLVQELDFSHQFGGRKVVYFGKYPYGYNGGHHSPQDIAPRSYLDSICCYLGVVLPSFTYNSVLINFYADGNDYMPLHSDNETCIEEQSEIVTISLGATRRLNFLDTNTNEKVKSVDLEHGSLSKMSKSSQSCFKHEIPPDSECSEMRISITFRLIKPPVKNPPLRAPPSNFPISVPKAGECGFVPYAKRIPAVPTQPVSSVQQSSLVNATSDVLYVSSSMYRYINTKKLSSPSVNAVKLFYPGADAAEMLSRLERDVPKLSIKPTAIYLMCGTNNVDGVYYGNSQLNRACSDLDNVIRYLRKVFPVAGINVLNILPRVVKGRNDVIFELNKHLESFCMANNLVNYMNTEYLFSSRNGKRKHQYFVPASTKIVDNCHLNKDGVERLGKYLKYWTHRHIKTE